MTFTGKVCKTFVPENYPNIVTVEIEGLGDDERTATFDIARTEARSYPVGRVVTLSVEPRRRPR